jgi:hypothetical protein
MGRWRITIDGTGCHHNGKRDIDADLATKDFVDELRAQGHTLHGATLEMVSGDVVVESAQNIDFLAAPPRECTSSFNDGEGAES